MNQKKIKLAFAGTPEIARIVLKSIIQSNKYDIGIIFTKPDQHAGRGLNLKQSEVKKCALENNIKTFQPKNSKELESYSLKNYDLLLVVAYGFLLTPKILAQPKFGCINIHTSLLPRWRGAAPIQRAIEYGDKMTGVSFMQMEKSMDTGPIFEQITCPINNKDTSAILHDRLAKISADNINRILTKIITRKLNAKEQNNSEVTYANKITKIEAELDWKKPAIELERKIRAYIPTPVASTTVKNFSFRVWEARVKVSQDSREPVTIVSGKKTLDIMTGKDILSITKLQLPGKKMISVKDFLNGYANLIED